MKILDIINEEINNLKELDYNFHRGTDNLNTNNGIKPHYSDNIISMRGRDTGHFGSGMYFSTYTTANDKRDYNDKFGEYSDYKNPEQNLTKVSDSLYRVDFDLYKNLYRVTSTKHGEFLFKSLKMLNNIFYGNVYDGIDSSVKFRKISDTYIKIKHNLNTIGLDLPNLREFLKMFNISSNDFNKVMNYSTEEKPSSYASFATRIMEYNGFNGVNVSGINGYDNTLHGSVIYDLSKLSSQPKKVDIGNLFSSDMKDDVIGKYDDFKTRMLRGEKINTHLDEFNTLPQNEQLIIMKRYYNFIPSYVINELNDFAKNIYFKWLPYKLIHGFIEDKPEKYDIEAIIVGDVNIIYNKYILIDGKSLFQYTLRMLWHLNDAKQELVLKSINRELSPEEQQDYNAYIEEWGEYLNLN